MKTHTTPLLAASAFGVHRHAIQATPNLAGVGKDIDDAMGSIQRENPTLKRVPPRDHARSSLATATRTSADRVCDSHWRDSRGVEDHVRLGGLVDIISNIGFNESAAKSKDVLGRVYKWFLGTPPFNMSDWGGENLRQAVRWKFGVQFSTTHELH